MKAKLYASMIRAESLPSDDDIAAHIADTPDVQPHGAMRLASNSTKQDHIVNSSSSTVQIIAAPEAPGVVSLKPPGPPVHKSVDTAMSDAARASATDTGHAGSHQPAQAVSHCRSLPLDDMSHLDDFEQQQVSANDPSMMPQRSGDMLTYKDDQVQQPLQQQCHQIEMQQQCNQTSIVSSTAGPAQAQALQLERHALVESNAVTSPHAQTALCGRHWQQQQQQLLHGDTPLHRRIQQQSASPVQLQTAAFPSPLYSPKYNPSPLQSPTSPILYTEQPLTTRSTLASKPIEQQVPLNLTSSVSWPLQLQQQVAHLTSVVPCTVLDQQPILVIQPQTSVQCVTGSSLTSGFVYLASAV